MNIKPLLISSTDSRGGAARACYRLFQSLQNFNLDCSLKVRKKGTNDFRVLGDTSKLQRLNIIVKNRLANKILKLQRSTSVDFRSINIFPSRWAKLINSSKYDVINLHWIGSETMSIVDVARVKKPVVMTLHDMWAFSGAAHTSSDSLDAGWRNGYNYNNRPASHSGVDLDKWTWNRKKRNWKQMSVVCPSSWLANCARESKLMADWPIYVIPNPLDVNLFKPLDRQFSRKALNLPPDQKLILFGADSGSKKPLKGYDLLLQALYDFRKIYGSDNIKCVIFGESAPKEDLYMPIPLQWMGLINDNITLALLYSAADIMVVPSRQEAFGQTASESLSCGTPVVAFNSTGLMDVVEHKITGYLANPFSTEDLAKGIKWLIEDEERNSKIGKAARARAVRLWNQEKVAMQYMNVYKEAIKEHKR